MQTDDTDSPSDDNDISRALKCSRSGKNIDPP